MTMRKEFLLARIEATEQLITAYEDAILKLTSDGVQQYSIDTGQSRQTVTRADLSHLQSQVGGLYNRLATLHARLNSASHYAGANW